MRHPTEMAQETDTFLDAASHAAATMSGPAMTSRQFPEVLREQLPTDGETIFFFFRLCICIYVDKSYVYT